ncbi:MAG: hypothetical protein HYW77_03145 [Parcubacteria group bacterium]|nr:hypothetical protein [Parcubacteria group bacterium]
MEPNKNITTEKLKQLEDLKEAANQEVTVVEKIKKLSPLILIAVVFIAVGLAGYFWYQAAALRKSSQIVVQEETLKLIASVSKLIILPEGETPTVATVSDLEALKSQPFFINAQIGDKVLIYTNLRKAILYRPAENKIVEVAPINIGTQTEKTSESTKE